MKIGELAQRAHCSAETIRYYEKIGLLPAALRHDNNYRHYSNQHLERLRFIRNCRSLDMTHEEIRQLLAFIDQPEQNCEPVTQLIHEHLGHVDRRLKELTVLRDQLQQLHTACNQPDSAQACGILEQLSHMDPLPTPHSHIKF